MINIEQEFLELYMPEIDWNRYEIENIERIEDTTIRPFTWRVDFYVVEKNIKPKWYENKKIVSKWFYKSKKVKDFQARTRIATVHIKKRKWYDEEAKKTVSEELKEEYKKQSPNDLIFFFKNYLKAEK